MPRPDIPSKKAQIHHGVDSMLNKYNNYGFLQSVIQTGFPIFEKRILGQCEKRLIYFQIAIKLFRVLFYSYLLELKGVNSPVKVVLWPVQHNHLDNMFPVASQLKNEGVKFVFVTDRIDLARRIEESGLPLMSPVWNHGYRFGLPRIAKTFSLLKASFWISKKLNLDLKVSLDDLLDSAIFYIRQTMLYSEIHQAVGHKYDLLGYENSAMCRPLILASKRVGNISGNIQHGLLNYPLAKYTSVDHNFIWDSISLQYMSRYGDERNLVLTGSPSKFAEREKVKSKVENKGLSLHQIGKNFILVCFSGPGHNVSVEGHELCISLLEKTVKEFSSQLFVIKLHPKDKKDYYNRLANSDNVVLIDSESPLFNLGIDIYIKKCICLITGASTTALEAFFQNKPVISLDVLGELKQFELLTNDLFYLSSTKSELSGALRYILTGRHENTERQNNIKKIALEYEKLLEEKPQKKIVQVIRNSISV